MLFSTLTTILALLIAVCISGALIYLFILLVKALKAYIRSKPARQAKAETTKSLGEAIQRYRTERKMTQEFVAEALGVSRQAVSKWESGKSDPSTANLIALAKLLKISPEELLSAAQMQGAAETER